MASLYADEDFHYGVVVELRQLGNDVLTVQEAGHCGAGDPWVLAFGTSQGRAVLTHNRRHFRRLHRRTPSHSGIIVCTRDNDAAALALRIHSAVLASPNLDNQRLSIIRPPKP